MPPPTKVFVGSLPSGSKPEELRILFANYGVVVECDVMNRCGFVHMETAGMAIRAIAALNGTNFKGQQIVVEEGRPKEKIANAGNNGRNSTNVGNNRQPRAALQNAMNGTNRANTNNASISNSRDDSSGRGNFNNSNNFVRNHNNQSGPMRNDAYKRQRNQPYSRPAGNVNSLNQFRNNNNFGAQRDVKFNRNSSGSFNNSSPAALFKNQESLPFHNNKFKNNGLNGGFRNNDNNNGFNSNQGSFNNNNNQYGGYGRSNPNNVQDRRGFALPNGNQMQQTQLSNSTNNQFNRNGNQFQGSQYKREPSFASSGDMSNSRNVNGNMFSQQRNTPNNLQNNRNSRGGGFNQGRVSFNAGRDGAPNNRFINHNYKPNGANTAMNGNFNNDYQKDFPQLGKQRNFGRGRNQPTSYNANSASTSHHS